MNHLEFQAEVRKHSGSFSLDCLDKTLENSQGEPYMSDSDMKLAILHMRSMLVQQHKLNDLLLAELIELKKPKKTFIQRLFKK